MKDDKQLVIALTDRITFAYKRLKQNQIISNPFAMKLNIYIVRHMISPHKLYSD